ncbi:PLD nuclease N-terminal domain-containing protein [Lacisediminihabitans changchengi]|uniref:PLDc_N domain-containing protein n=1 Tax=Lacisediminihabitans changchengi TaxID=2787634 RepID=A0A934SP21_9MICO|nr:PLD nuclease N-terminal domain-containing protein [Lacisediminihabitans changchengi]MBK4348970.1 PLDc_N domain-containing protein [Lacisediminihabitans changchengi]
MNGTDLTHVVVVALVTASWLALWVLAVASIMRRPTVARIERGVWVTLVIIFPFIGPLAWFAWGRSRQRQKLS